MKRILSFSFVFFLCLGLFSVNVFAAPTTAQLDAITSIGPYFAERDLGTFLISSSPLTTQNINGSLNVTANEYKWDNGILEYRGSKTASASSIIYANHDITNSDGSVFFSAPLPPVPKALREIVPNLIAQALKILPVAIAIMAGMMGVSLISRVLYRYL